jgi:hypothetical protein
VLFDKIGLLRRQPDRKNAIRHFRRRRQTGRGKARAIDRNAGCRFQYRFERLAQPGRPRGGTA